jgi:glyoxylase-like metal-dependent hydrolase (beta-lactamase superfamily II)
MNLLEQQLDYPLGDTLPPPGTAMEVAPGIRWVRMALPFALDHINLWLLRDHFDGRDGWTVIDCCIDAPGPREQWESLFSSTLEGLPVLRVLVTHMHPDHIGLAHWLCERWDAPLWISATDYYAARLGTHGSGFGGDGSARFFESHGLTDPDAVQQIRQRTDYYRSMVPELPRSFRRLMDSDTVRIGDVDWRCMAGYGHAPEHIALYSAKLGVLIGGDMMLPRISTNVSVFDAEPEADALALFLRSIEGFAPLPADTLTLPSHGKPFRGLHTRIKQLQDHHRDRLDEVRAACAESPQSAADVMPILFKRQLDLHQTTFAMGEAVAHLHMLWHSGELRRTRDAQGVYRFSPA